MSSCVSNLSRSECIPVEGITKGFRLPLNVLTISTLQPNNQILKYCWKEARHHNNKTYSQSCIITLLFKFLHRFFSSSVTAAMGFVRTLYQKPSPHRNLFTSTKSNIETVLVFVLLFTYHQSVIHRGLSKNLLKLNTRNHRCCFLRTHISQSRATCNIVTLGISHLSAKYSSMQHCYLGVNHFVQHCFFIIHGFCQFKGKKD